MSHLRLYEHPANRRLFGVGVPQLYISGTLPNAKPSLAYEGRLQIVNAGGPCSVQLVSGTLPLGATVTVDNDTKQIVVAWPAYEASAIAIPNSGFENGDIGWEFGAGWSVTEDNPVTGVKAAQYLDNSGDSIIAHAARAEIAPGHSLSASCSVRQGASSSGNAGACVLLEFFDVAGDTVNMIEGNMIYEGSNNVVQLSTVTATAPEDAVAVRVGSRGFRKRQNKKVWVDDFTWNLTQPSVGTDVEGLWCIALRVKDALGREAEWSGCIKVTNDIPVYLALQSGGATKLYRSDAGDTWNTSDTIPAATQSGSCLLLRMFDGTLFQAIGQGLWRSTDQGESWMLVKTMDSGWYARDLIKVDGKLYLVPAGDTSTGMNYYTSIDNGDSWQTVQFNPGGLGLSGIAVRGSTIIIPTAGGGYINLSVNGGASWLNDISVSGTSYNTILATPTCFLMLQYANPSNIWRSLTGVAGTWTQITYPGKGSGIPQHLARDADTGRILLILDTGVTAYSDDDGVTWTAGATLSGLINPTPYNRLFSINRRFLITQALGSLGGRVYYSPDGVTPWTNDGTGFNLPMFIAGERIWP